MTDPLDDVPDVVVKAAMEAAESAKSLSDLERRRHLVIVVCHSEDPVAAALWDAILLASPNSTPATGEATWAILPHAILARLAREVGYLRFPELPEAGIGRMRMYLFAGGAGIGHGEMVIEEEAVVLREIADRRTRDEPEARRILHEKRHLVQRAMKRLLGKPGQRERQIVIVFGSRTGLSPSIYRVLAALPAQDSFPRELPPGVPVIVVDCSSFLEALKPHLIELPRIDLTTLGPNQVHVAVLMDGFLLQVAVESVPYTSVN